MLWYLVVAGLVATTLGVMAVVGAYFYVAPDLPSVEALRDVQLQVPLRVYSRDGALIAEYGEQRRVPLRFEDAPKPLIQAVLAAEDDRFFEHPGVDYQGLLRAALNLILTGEKSQGGSTITMQVARNFFLSFEKTYRRKISEIFLALKIERELSKEEILTLYLNKIYLGNRAYGVGAAAEVYYGTTVDELSLAQLAMIAGLPKAPSRFNPLANPDRALERRSYVLGRMLELGHLDEATYSATLAEPVTAAYHGSVVELEAHYLGEMVRAEMVARYGDAAYTAGYRVITSVDSRLQRIGNVALRNALTAYDRRYGFRGPVSRLELTDDMTAEEFTAALADIPSVASLRPALVTDVMDQSANILLPDNQAVLLNWESMSWAKPYIDGTNTGPEPEIAGDVLTAGDIVYVEQAQQGDWQLAQAPQVQGALVSIDPTDGAIVAIEGGYDFYSSKFNRVIQAERQPGSSFKPFIYSAALDADFTPATIVNDAPVVFADAALEAVWRPENDSRRFYGPTRLREALVNSRNLVSIRVLRSMGVGYAVNYLERFGFVRESLPRDLSLALGSVSLTPLQVVSAYAVLGNGGYRVEPYFIDRIIDISGEVIEQADPAYVCMDCYSESENESDLLDIVVDIPDETQPVAFAKQVMSQQTNYLITGMMYDVIKRGTGRRALELGRNDLAGKTGTTNEFRDAWFSGFNSDLATTVWVGFDDFRPLGPSEYGGRAALPMWIEFMGGALKNVAERARHRPPGLVTVRISPETGLLASAGTPNAIFETFKADN
ncbi:MAG: penicillin-binding protein 1A, partial [Gammaproteobacteria bacterium]|nr:penicillin-binding protein 1A [Gammaproteobacteria bacterium]